MSRFILNLRSACFEPRPSSCLSRFTEPEFAPIIIESLGVLPDHRASHISDILWRPMDEEVDMRLGNEALEREVWRDSGIHTEGKHGMYDPSSPQA